MTYNKEYIEQLLQRFVDGETTEQEELFLAEYFSTSDSIPEEWEAYREMFASFSTDAYDFTEEELNKFVEEEAPKTRTISLWPWFAAACVAALMIIASPQPSPEGRETTIVQTQRPTTPQSVKDKAGESLMSSSSIEGGAGVEPQTASEEKQLAELTDKQATTAKQKASVPTPKQKESTAEPTPVHNELAATDEPAMNEENIMAEQASLFKEMEMAFLSHSAPIRERGQQVMHRVAMLQQEQRNQQQFVEL